MPREGPGGGWRDFLAAEPSCTKHSSLPCAHCGPQTHRSPGSRTQEGASQGAAPSNLFLRPCETDRSGQTQPQPKDPCYGLTKSLQHPRHCTFSEQPQSKMSRTRQDNALMSKTPSTPQQAKPEHHRAPPCAHRHLTPERCPSAICPRQG